MACPRLKEKRANGPAKVFDKFSPWRCDLLCLARFGGVALGFSSFDCPVGDGCGCGREPVRLREVRRAGNAARAGGHSTDPGGVERVPPWSGGFIFRTSCRTHFTVVPAWSGGFVIFRTPWRAHDVTGDYRENRVRLARQSRGDAGSEKAVFPRPLAAVAVRDCAPPRRSRYGRDEGAPCARLVFTVPRQSGSDAYREPVVAKSLPATSIHGP